MNQSIRSTEEIEILFKKKNKLGNVRYRGRSQTTLTRRGRKVVLEMSTVCRFSIISVKEFFQKCQQGVGS